MLFGVWLLYFSFGLTVSSMAPLVAPVIRDLGMTHTQMGSILGAWQLIYIFSAVPSGSIVDRLGARRSLFIATLIIAASGLFRSFSQDYLSLFAAVALFGLGGPMISAGAPKVISECFTGRERGFAMGVYITGPAVAAVFTLMSTNALFMPMLGHEWRYVVVIWAGITLLSGFVWLLISSNGWSDKENNESRTPEVRSSVAEFGSLLKLPAVRIVLFMSICVFAFNHGLNHWLPAVLGSAGLSPVQAGYWAAIPTLVGIVGSLLIPRFATPDRRLIILAVLAACSGIASLCLQASFGSVLVAGLILQGIARSALTTIAILTLIEMPGVGEKRVGLASGVFFAAAEIGGVLGPLSIGLLHDVSGNFSAGLYLLTMLATVVLISIAMLRQSLAAAHRSQGGAKSRS